MLPSCHVASCCVVRCGAVWCVLCTGRVLDSHRLLVSETTCVRDYLCHKLLVSQTTCVLCTGRSTVSRSPVGIGCGMLWSLGVVRCGAVWCGGTSHMCRHMCRHSLACRICVVSHTCRHSYVSSVICVVSLSPVPLLLLMHSLAMCLERQRAKSCAPVSSHLTRAKVSRGCRYSS